MKDAIATIAAVILMAGLAAAQQKATPVDHGQENAPAGYKFTKPLIGLVPRPDLHTTDPRTGMAGVNYDIACTKGGKVVGFKTEFPRHTLPSGAVDAPTFYMEGGLRPDKGDWGDSYQEPLACVGPRGGEQRPDAPNTFCTPVMGDQKPGEPIDWSKTGLSQMAKRAWLDAQTHLGPLCN